MAEAWEKATSEIKGGADKDVRRWQGRLDRGIAKRRPHARMWRKFKKYADLDHYHRTDLSDTEKLDLVAVNKVRAFINSRVSTFVFKNPRFKVEAINPDGTDLVQVQTGEIDPVTGQPAVREVERSKVTEHVLNFVASQPAFGAARTARRVARAAMVSMGWSKVGYEAEFANGAETEELYAYDEESGEFLRDPTTGEMIPVESEEYGRPYPLKPTSERWFWDWIPAHRIILDPDGENEFYDHRWVAIEYYMTIEDVRSNPKFRKSVVEKLSGTMRAKDFSDQDEVPTDTYEESGSNDPDLRSDTEYVRLFEVWDIENQRLRYMADGCGEFLYEGDYPDGVLHSPLSCFAPDEDLSGDAYARPPVADGIPLSEEYDVQRSLDLQGMRSNTQKWGVTEGAIDDDQLEIIESPTNNAIFKVKEGYDPGAVIKPLPRPMTPPDHFNQISMIARDFDEVMGQASEARGVASSKLATGIAAIQQAAAVREDDYRSQFTAFLRDVGKKLLDSLQANMSKETAIRIKGPDGQFFQGYVDPDMIQGDFDVSVDVEDMMPRNTDVEFANTVQLMNLFGQYPHLGLDEGFAGALLDMARMNQASVREGLKKISQMMMQAQMAPPAGANAPDSQGEAGPVEGMGDLAAQIGGRL